jgi:hypothetical protein
MGLGVEQGLEDGRHLGAYCMLTCSCHGNNCLNYGVRHLPGAPLHLSDLDSRTNKDSP